MRRLRFPRLSFREAPNAAPVGRETTFQQAFEGGTWGGMRDAPALDPRNHSQHIVKSAAACATPRHF